MIKPSICFFTQQYGYLWSGVGTYATYLIDTLAERGYRVIVVSHEEPRRARGQIHKNVKLITVPQVKCDPSIGRWFSLSYKFSRVLRQNAEAGGCDIFHFTDAREALWCPALRKPIVGSMHDYYFADASKNPFYFKKFYKDWVKRWLYYNAVHMAEPAALRKLSAVICNSYFVRGMLIDRYRIPENKLQVVYYGIKSSARESDDTFAALEGGPSILFVGANFQRKGLPVLLRAAALLKQEFPGLKLYVIGKDANENKMKELCGNLGLSARVNFMGWRGIEEVLAFYRRADMFVMPSLIEGFGFTFMEAMDAGIPVIGGNTGGTKELITDGVDGFLVEPGNYRQLARSISMLARDKALREKIIQNAFVKLQKFSLDKMVDATVGIYEKLLLGANLKSRG